MQYLRRWLLGKLAVAFYTWAENVVEFIESRERRQEEARERMRAELRLEAAGVKMVYKSLCRVLWTAFTEWHKVGRHCKA